MKPTNYFLFILFAAFLFWMGCKCNDCPPTFEESKDGCICPDGTFKLDDKCLKLKSNEYYIPFENTFCFDTMFIQIDTKFCDSSKIICENVFQISKNSFSNGPPYSAIRLMPHQITTFSDRQNHLQISSGRRPNSRSADN